MTQYILVYMQLQGLQLVGNLQLVYISFPQLVLANGSLSIPYGLFSLPWPCEMVTLIMINIHLVLTDVVI